MVYIRDRIIAKRLEILRVSIVKLFAVSTYCFKKEMVHNFCTYTTFK